MKVFSVFILFLLFCSNLLKAQTAKIAVAATSDLQSVILPYEISVEDRKFTVGGFDRISAYKKKLWSDSRYDAVLLVSSGDDFINPLFSMFSGEPEVLGMNMAGYDFYCPGNHEFDNGAEMFSEAMKNSDFEIICANLSFSDTFLQKTVNPFAVVETEGVKIGFFGLMTPDFFKLTNPGDSQVFLKPDILRAAEIAVTELKNARCDAIIGLTHTGFVIDSILAENIEGIDAIIGGHDHILYHREINGVVLVQNGARAQTIGVLCLDFRDNNLENLSFFSEYLDSTAGSDDSVRKAMEAFEEKYKTGLSVSVGTSLTPFDATRAVVRGRESNIGDLICDSWLAWFSNADAAFVNGGSIRGDVIYPAGDVTYGKVMEILPFRNELIEVKMTGGDIKQVLEVSASGQLGAPFECPDSMRASYGGFLQVGGMRFVIDTLKPSFCAIYSGREVQKIIEPGDRIHEVEILLDGVWTPLDSGRIYSLIVSDWIAGGGDGHFVFLDSAVEKKSTSVYAPDPLLDFFIKRRTVEAVNDGRIRIK